MRFNDKELASLSLADPDMAGRLNYRKTGNFGQSGSVFKERWFKLKYNLLFYFKITDGRIEGKPSGVFVLESAKVQMDLSGAYFAFSITFLDDPNKKHIFSARSEVDVHSWVNTLKKAPYEYLRNQLILLQVKISRRTGRDPLLMYPRNKGTVRDLQPENDHSQQHSSSFVKSTFKSHLRFSEVSHVHPTTQIVPETNLIEL